MKQLESTSTYPGSSRWLTPGNHSISPGPHAIDYDPVIKQVSDTCEVNEYVGH